MQVNGQGNELRTGLAPGKLLFQNYEIKASGSAPQTSGENRMDGWMDGWRHKLF